MRKLTLANSDILKEFERIWRRVQKEYSGGFLWSERNLQAALYCELRRIREFNVVVEPTWQKAKKKIKPDLVLVSKNGITDIFEIKFSPHTSYRKEWHTQHPRSDIRKLLSYLGNEPYDEHPVRLDPKTGQYEKEHCLPVPEDCRLHFVAVARRGFEEQWPPCHERVNQWCGYTGDRFADSWKIEFA